MTNPHDPADDGQPPMQPGPHSGESYGGPGQPPPAQQQWPGQPGPTGPGPTKKTGTIVAVVAAAAVVLAGAGVGIAAALGAFSSEESKVEDAVESVVEAVNTGDGDKVLTLVCEEELEYLEESMDYYGETADEFFARDDDSATLAIDITDVSISSDGDSATVTYDSTITMGGEEVETDTDMSERVVKEDGSWKVC